MRKDLIDNVVMGLLELYENANPLSILNDMGIDVVEVPQSDSKLLNNNSNVVLPMNVVFLNEALEEHLKAFYLRHELGHILLHTDKNNVMFPNTGRMEKEANYFAWKLTNAKLDSVELENMTLEQIASCLNVPYEVMNQLVNF